MSFKLKGLLAGLAVCLLPGTPWASDFQSPRTSALGGAGHAGPLLNDALFLNPAYVSLLPTYAISANYGFYGGTGEGDNTPRGNLLNLSIQDGRSELFQAGLGFTRRDDATLLNVGASKSVAARTGVGVGGKFIFPKDGSRKMITDVTLAFTMIPIEWFQTCLIVDNLIQSNESKAHGFYREYVLGTKTNIQGIFLLYFDPHLVPDDPVNDSFGYEAGAEFPIMQDFFLRFGMFRNAMIAMANRRERGFSFGGGWIAPRLSLDYGFTRAIEPASFNAHTLGFTIYF